MYRRKPAVAGAFYPANPQRLSSMIESYLNEAAEGLKPNSIVGVVSPHAGYVYSGPVAAFSFRPLMGSDATLAVVLAPSHRARFNGAAYIAEGVYESPLGDVEIDATVGNALKDKKYFTHLPEAHQIEHSLEVQVPFLQKVLHSFSLVPVIVGTTELEICAGIADDLAQVLKVEERRCIIVISTDLSHYHSYDQARVMDKRFIDVLESFDEKKVKEVLSGGKAEACGEGPVLAGMALCRKLGARFVKILKYATSGDTAGDKSQVVGYLSAAFIR